MQPKTKTKRRRPGDPQFLRKSAQLARQIERQLALALAELEDPQLSGLLLVACAPTADASRIRVELACEPGSPVSMMTPLERAIALAKLRARLREEVASAIHRRRTPELDLVLT
jgi:ribosome-binding factor A